MVDQKKDEKTTASEAPVGTAPAPTSAPTVIGKSTKARERGEEVTNELPEWWNSPDNNLVEGSVLEGFYRGWKLIKPGSADAPFKIYVIEVEETGELYSFSGTVASRKMGRVPRDCYVWITYEGKKKTGTGKRNAAHQFKVELPKGVMPLPETLDFENAAE